MNKILVEPSLGFLEGMRGFILWFWYTDQSLEGDEFFPDLAVISIVYLKKLLYLFLHIFGTFRALCSPVTSQSRYLDLSSDNTEASYTKISSKRFDTKNLVRNRQFWNTEQDL